jgi:hypothetical protein
LSEAAVLWRKRHNKVAGEESAACDGEILLAALATETERAISEASITFSATFFLACLAAMALEGVVLEEI